MTRFEELVAAGHRAPRLPGVRLGGDPRQPLDGVTAQPPAPQPGAGPLLGGKRVEREAARRERLAETRKKRAEGEHP